MVSYHFINSCFVVGFSKFCSSMLDRTCRVLLTDIFVYKFVMPREASLKWGKIGVFCNFPISSRVFSMLYVLGRGQAV
jgi:hypothetical protein